MRDQNCKDGLSGWWYKRVAVNRRDGGRAIRALLSRCLELRITANKLIALCHAHHAVMLPIAAAARRQVRLALGT
jgi:hypothetical protein